MPRIFISYRRTDSQSITDRINDRLIDAFGSKNIFKDVDRIPPGSTFADVLESGLRQCNVLLVIIGKHWVNITDDEGKRRLTDPADFVRIEVERGLNRPDMLVIPVLVEGAQVPDSDDLPDSLDPLVSKQVVTVRPDPDFNRDIKRLLEFLRALDERDAFVKRGAQRRTLAIVGLVATLIVAAAIFLLASGIIKLPTGITPTFDPFSAANRLLTLTKEAEIAALSSPTENYTATIDAILTQFALETIAAYTPTPSATPTLTATQTASNTPTITPTPTQNKTATAAAQSTSNAASTQAQATNDLLGTRNAPTNTAQPTVTLTRTPRPTQTATATPTPTATMTATLTPTLDITATFQAQAVLNAEGTQAVQAAQSTLSVQSIQQNLSPTPATTGIITATQNVRLRSGPGTENAVVANLAPGAEVIVLDVVGDGAWVHVQLANGRTGYVSSAVISVAGTPPQTAVSTGTPLALASLTPDAELAQLVQDHIARNQDWTPVIRTINGVDMVLVPPGCFDMGSDNNSSSDEMPVHNICVEQPFWLDLTEVTNQQFTNMNILTSLSSISPEPDFPRDNISWFEARNFCAQRGGRLPTELEWEYAARGPNSQIYPWAEPQFIGDNVVYNSNSDNSSASVGSRPSGASWVGALDMSGNLWEWTSSIYQPYPYVADDGRENLTDGESERTIRGGSWSSGSFSLRSSNRDGFGPNVQGIDVGFRCVVDYTAP